MENSYVLPALAKRRAETAGELEKAQARVRQLHADLACLDAVIRQFDPAYPVGAIRPRHARAPAGEAHAGMARAVLDALRRAGRPLTGPEVAEAVMAERGLDAGDRAVRDATVAKAGRSLRHQRARGAVRLARRRGKCAVWELAAD